MITAKRLAQLAKKWQSMAAMGRKRLTQNDGERFEVPLAYLGTAFFRELLRMSQEEFGFASGNDGRMTLTCEAAVAEYAMCLLRRDAPVEVVMAFLCSIERLCCFDSGVCSIERLCCFDSGVVVSCVGLIQHVAVC
ncbi:auxin-responsive protein SAUR36-like [Hordeum vulgare]|nr:auxin-responsive protein SAUR36-like [Hordeum vulgare]